MLSTKPSIAQPQLEKKELFSVEASRICSSGPFAFRIAVDTDETIAFFFCSNKFIYLISNKGKIRDSIEVPVKGCLGNMEFDEFDNLLFTDSEEKILFRYNQQKKKLETFSYEKPEDWYARLNHFFRDFKLSSIPTQYANNEYLQGAYRTRFAYSYNLYSNYATGFLYQCSYNVIRKINNHSWYIQAKKDDCWISDFVTHRSKLLLVDEANKRAVYYDRVYDLILEDFKTGEVKKYPCIKGGADGVQFDFSVNRFQNKVFGVSGYNDRTITFSSWHYVSK